MSLDWFIARRYLFNRERRSLVSVITLIAMSGVAVGVAALVVVISVMDGANELLMREIARITPHIMVRHIEGENIAPSPALLQEIQALPEVAQAQPVLTAQGFIQAGSGVEVRKQGLRLVGMPRVGPEAIVSAHPVDPAGQAVTLGPREIMLGKALAEKISARPGDPVRIFTVGAETRSMINRPQVAAFRVVGIFETGYYQFDEVNAFARPEDIREFFAVGPGASYLHITLHDPAQADAVRARLDLPAAWTARTWMQENIDFFASLQIQKYSLFLILLLIILVAAFNIIGTLILMVIEKTREVGILKAVGASPGRIGRIFLLDGLLIGAVGTLAGVVVGVILCAVVAAIRFPMPAQIYNFESLPVTVKPLTVAVIVVSALLVCVLASVFPARAAARLDPVEALRYE